MLDRRQKRGLGALALSLGLLFGLAGIAQAQVTTGGIAGQVVDTSSGSALPGATVTITHVPTNSVQTVTTDAQGRFALPNARVGGPYTVRASLDGFQPAEQTEVTVGLGRFTEVPLALDLEQISEEITITGTAEEMINPNRMGSESMLNSEQIEAFPTVRRNILLDGAKTNPYASIRASDDNQKDISFAGRSSKYNNIQIDGSNYNDLFGLGESGGTPAGQSNAQPIQQDVVAEIQVAVSPYDIRQGGFTGGAINAVTKSGTNEFHGSGYYAQRDEDSVGDGPFNVPVKTFDEEQYGGSLGGFLARDKAWFFVAAESNDNTTQSGFSADGSTGQQFSKPADAARFEQILIDRYGHDPGGLGDVPIATESEHFFARADWNVADAHQLTFRYNLVDAFRDDVATRSTTQFRFPDATFQRDAQVDSYVAQLNSIFGTSFNELRVGYQTLDDVRTFPEAFPSIEVGGAPRRADLIAGTEQFSGVNTLEQEILEVHDDLTFLKGDHTFTVGTHNEFFDIKNFFLSSAFGYYFFPTVDAFDAGIASEYQISFANGADPNAPVSAFEIEQYGLYGGDQWRVRDNLTLTYGLRADYAMLPDDPAHNPAVQASLGFDTSEVPSDNLILSPRLGFNWDPDGGGKQQVRGGIGLFSGRAPYVWISNVYAGTGIASTALTARGSIPFNPDPLNQPHSGAGATPSVDLIDPNFEFPQVLRGNLAYDRELEWWDLRVSAEILYTQTQEDIFYVNENRVATGAVNPLDSRPRFARESTAFSDAPLLTNTNQGEELLASIVISRPARDGFGFTAGYTYMDSENAFDGTSSRAISNWQFHPTQGDIFDDPKSTSSWENENRYWVNLNYSFETGRVVHTLGAFYNAESGRPYSVLVGAATGTIDANSDGFATNDLLYMPSSPDEVILSGFTWEQFQNYAASHDLSPGIAERNGQVGPWVRRLDIHYGIEVPISRIRTQFTVDLVNALNLIDEDQGVVEYVAFGTTTPIRTSIDAATGKTVYTQNFTNAIANPKSAFVVSDIQSRWNIRLGLRLSF